MRRSSLNLFCMIALFGVLASAQTFDFTWKNSSFAVPPKIVTDATSVPSGGTLSSSTILLPGPVSGTNTLLSVYTQDGKFTLFRQILDVFEGTVLQSFDPIATSIPTSGVVKYTASLNGYLAFAAAEQDDSGLNQIFVYKMLLNGSAIERVAATTNTDSNIVYKLLSIFNDNINIAIGYEQGSNSDDGTYQATKMLINKLNFIDNSLGVEFPVTNGAVTFASCDSIPYTSTAYCLFKQDSTTRGAVLSLTNTFSQSPVTLMNDNDLVTYNPLYLAGVNGYYVSLISAKQGNQISLIGKIVASTYGPKVINKWSLSNDFVSFGISSVLPYYDGFLIFYSVTDSSNNQYWYYQAFSKNFDVELSATLIASVPSTYMLSSFTTAPASTGGSPSGSYFDNDYSPVNTDYGNPIGLLAVQSTPSQTLYAWYGQILNQTVDTNLISTSSSSQAASSGELLTPILMIASFILGLLLIC